MYGGRWRGKATKGQGDAGSQPGGDRAWEGQYILMFAAHFENVDRGLPSKCCFPLPWPRDQPSSRRSIPTAVSESRRAIEVSMRLFRASDWSGSISTVQWVLQVQLDIQPARHGEEDTWELSTSLMTVRADQGSDGVAGPG